MTRFKPGRWSNTKWASNFDTTQISRTKVFIPKGHKDFPWTKRVPHIEFWQNCHSDSTAAILKFGFFFLYKISKETNIPLKKRRLKAKQQTFNIFHFRQLFRLIFKYIFPLQNWKKIGLGFTKTCSKAWFEGGIIYKIWVYSALFKGQIRYFWMGRIKGCLCRIWWKDFFCTRLPQALPGVFPVFLGTSTWKKRLNNCFLVCSLSEVKLPLRTHWKRVEVWRHQSRACLFEPTYFFP